MIPHSPRGIVAALAATVTLAVPGTALAQSYGLLEIGSFAHTDVFDVGAAEISAYDVASERLFVVNGEVVGLDVLDLSDPTNPTKIDVLSVGSGEVTSCSVRNNVVAVVASEGDGLPGTISFFDATTLEQLGSTFTVGPTPDSVFFSPDGRTIAIVHEGEPDYEAGLDPDGSIGFFVIDEGVSPDAVAALSAKDLTYARFDAFNEDKDALIASGVRIFGDPENPDGPFGADAVTVAQDLEPEIITFSADSSTGWVSLQENNALAIVDIVNQEITDVVPLGLADHSVAGHGIDASDQDGAINITTWPVQGMYMTDSLATYEFEGETYVVFANEGDDRGDDVRASELFEDGLLDLTAFEDPDTLFADENLGRLNVTTVDGDLDGDGLIEQLQSFGSRSFSIRDAAGTLVFDSGDMIEQMIAAEIPDHFNSDNDDPEFDNKSDSQGPEPEGITVGVVNGRTICFVGMEDVGGIMLFDVTDPADVTYQSYFNFRDFDAEHDPDEPGFDLAALGNTGPEGLTFIPATDSPNGVPLLVVSYEVTGTTGIYQVTVPPCTADVDGDGAVALGDLLALLAAWGPCADCPPDFDGSGVVDVNDLLTLLASWGPCA